MNRGETMENDCTIYAMKKRIEQLQADIKRMNVDMTAKAIGYQRLLDNASYEDQVKDREYWERYRVSGNPY